MIHDSARRHRTPFLGVAIIAILLGLTAVTGCGGGSGGGDPVTNPPATSRIHVTVQWADRSRSVAAPGSALSATVTLAGAKVGGGDETFTVNRNDNIAAHTETYDSPEDAFTGSRTMGVNFYAQAGGAGSLVATAIATVHISGSGDIPDAVTNIQKTIKSVTVTSGQQVGVGEDRFLTFTARDMSGNIVAVTDGSARFAAADGADKIVVAGIVGTGLAAGVASVTATVDGVTSSPTPVTVLAPVAIAYVGGGQNPQSIAFVQLLQARHITPTRFDAVPSPATLQNFDILMLDATGNVGIDDAAKVQAFLALGRGVVLLDRAPALLATGSAALDADLSPIAPWFGGVTGMAHTGHNYRAVSARTTPGLFALPPALATGGLVYETNDPDDLAALPSDLIQNPSADRVATTPTGGVYALAYALPAEQGGGRVYWQFHPYGLNSAYTNRVLALLITGTNWAAHR